MVNRIESVNLGTPFSPTAKKVLLCGAGELGKEVVIEMQRLGVEVIAVDRYPNAPAMQVADRSHVISMLDGAALEAVVRAEMPDLIIPEIEAIATDTLVALEKEGFGVAPSARATQLTMNREGIRRLVAEDLGIHTSPYRFADTQEEYLNAVAEIGLPCVVKPVMSSSGKGQSTLREEDQIHAAWAYAQSGGRAGQGRVIVEGFIPFDYEITLLTIRHRDGVSFCEAIGHRQEQGDYRESWQPQAMAPSVLEEAKRIAETVTEALGGLGLFGVELFIQGEEVFFSEVSPRPHDTGMVTMISQNLSEFALHTLAVLNLPIPTIRQYGPAASSVILVEGESQNVRFGNLQKALSQGDTQLRLFGKPEVSGMRRMGVGLALGESIDEALEKATFVSDTVSWEL
ncbi:MAG: formate-dependent phosphoribosylglycinamide formyltransferase [Pseudomonadales bacterium]|nr:formate-dependent phosphoribosylglycinamide formyltransferase [Pseudomonadales bacterium]